MTCRDGNSYLDTSGQRGIAATGCLSSTKTYMSTNYFLPKSLAIRSYIFSSPDSKKKLEFYEITRASFVLYFLNDILSAIKHKHYRGVLLVSQCLKSHKKIQNERRAKKPKLKNIREKFEGSLSRSQYVGELEMSLKCSRKSANNDNRLILCLKEVNHLGKR